MKVEDVKKLYPTDQFLYWMRERHQVYLRRRAGKPKPWTDDEVMQRYFFTNPYREHDKVTVWFKNNVREPLRDDPRVLFATVAFRWFNFPPTAVNLMGTCTTNREPVKYRPERDLLLNWDAEEALRRLDAQRKYGMQVFTGAYMINSPGGRPKLEAIIERIDKAHKAIEVNGAVGRMRNWFTYWAPNNTLEGAHGMLSKLEGMGGFMAYEVVCDLRYTYLLENAADTSTWCNPGPGCIRGLYRVWGEDWAKKGDNSSSPPRPKDWQERMKSLLEIARRRLRGMPPMEMREIEHSLCELDKYLRLVHGDGRAKRTFKGT